MADLSIEIAGVKFKNPVLTASGTFGYGTELKDSLPLEKLGGIVSKGLTIKPKVGNPPQRLIETPCGLINSIGLENMGIREFVKTKLPELKELGVRVIANISGDTEAEYLEAVEIADDAEGIDAIELNVSCPNVEKGGMEFGRNPGMLEQLVSGVRKKTRKPLWVKITPNFVDIEEEARAAINGGADAISAVNTLLGMHVNVREKRFSISRKFGGLSGPAIRPVALYIVWKLVQTVDVPVIAIGGIDSLDAALQFLFVGARAVQIGTANFVDPRVPFKIVDGLNKYLDKEGFHSISEIIGVLN